MTTIGQRAHDIREGIYAQIHASPPPWTFTTDLFGLTEGDVPLVLMGAFREPFSCPANTPPESLTVVIPLVNRAKPKQDTMIYVWAVKAARTIFTQADTPASATASAAAAPPAPSSPQLSTATVMYRAVVPPNAPPGTHFIAQAGGHSFDLVVPEGAMAGRELVFPGPAPIGSLPSPAAPATAAPPASAPSLPSVMGSQTQAGTYKYVDDKATGDKTLYVTPRLNPNNPAAAAASASATATTTPGGPAPSTSTPMKMQAADDIPVAVIIDEHADAAPPIPLPRTSIAMKYYLTASEKEVYGSKLKAFYLKHDPSKSLLDIEDLIMWVATRPKGMEEMNAKLMKKYGKDVNSIEDDAVNKMSALDIRAVHEENLDDLI
jgi:hypothetical protein